MKLLGVEPKEILFYQSGTTLIESMLEKAGITIDRNGTIWKEELYHFMNHINHRVLDAQWWYAVNVISAWREWKGDLTWDMNTEHEISFTYAGNRHIINTLPKAQSKMSEIAGTVDGINAFFEEQWIPYRVLTDIRYRAYDKETTARAAEEIASYSVEVGSRIDSGMFEGDTEGLGFLWSRHQIAKHRRW